MKYDGVGKRVKKTQYLAYPNGTAEQEKISKKKVRAYKKALVKQDRR